MLNNSVQNRFEPFVKISAILIFVVYLFLAQFTTSYPYNHLLPIPTPAILTLGVSSLFFLYWLLYRGPGVTNNADSVMTLFIKLFVISILLSILSSIYTGLTLNSVEYTGYLKKSSITRILYYSAFIAMIYFGYKFLINNGTSKSLKLLKIYPLSIIFLVLIGIWQLLYFLYGVPFLDIETRSYVHSVSGITFFNFRLTSFADEPSYLGPFIIDMLILGYLVFKRKWIYAFFLALPGISILLFSFSVSGYLNLAIIIGFVFIYLLFHPKVPKKYLLMLVGISLIAIMGLALLKPELFMKLFSPITGRLSNLFNPESSSRIYMYVMPVRWLFDHSIISAMFGYGPGSFDFLSHSKILPNSGSVSTSSNNMYIDLLFENGVIGFSLIMIALSIIFVLLLKNGRKNVFYFIGLLEFVHLLITSMYRADFVTPRFWIVLLFIFILIRAGEETEREKRQLGE